MFVDPRLSSGEVIKEPLLGDLDAIRENEHNLMAVQTALSGLSMVDSGRLALHNRDAIDQFLRLHQFDTDNPFDIRYIKQVHRDAIMYLAETQRYRIPRAIEQVDDIYELFAAANQHDSKRVQRFACMTLKVMQILHHLASRELVFETAISEADLLGRLNSKVFRVIDEIRVAGIHVHEFATGQKKRTSLVTKLLAKSGGIATHVFDKLRFRIIVDDIDEVILTLVQLMRRLVPCNYVVPGESQNGLISIEDLHRVLKPNTLNEAKPSAAALKVSAATPRNEFSGSTYKSVNFVADIPLRIDDVAPEKCPAIAVVQAEIQLMDLATAKANEEGENAHALYKKRQRERARERLEEACKNP